MRHYQSNPQRPGTPTRTHINGKVLWINRRHHALALKDIFIQSREENGHAIFDSSNLFAEFFRKLDVKMVKVIYER